MIPVGDVQIVFLESALADLARVASGHLVLTPVALSSPGMSSPGRGQDRRDLSLHALEYGEKGFVQGTGPIQFIVLPLQPTFDDVLAAHIVKRALEGDSIPEGLNAFAHYAKTIRQGLPAGRLPPDEAPEGIFWAIRSETTGELSDAPTAALFLANCARLVECILRAAEQGLDPHRDLMFDVAEFSLERALLTDDKKVYRQDVARGKSWVVCIPDGPPEASALVLDRPRSMLFKHWSRSDERAPSGEGYTLLVCNEGDGKWVMTTPRNSRLSLKPLADAFQVAEADRDASTMATDPWYDGVAFDHTLVAAPRRGTRLTDAQVLQVVQNWAKSPRVNRATLRRTMLIVASVVVAIATGFAISRHFHAGQGTVTDASKGEGSVTTPEASGDSHVADAVPLSTKRGRPLPYVRNGAVEKGIHLYGLNIGVSDYEDDSFDLAYADDDAEAFHKTLNALEGRPFAKVVIQKLVNQDATRSNIITQFAWLKKQATQHDLVIVTVSGHGMREDEDFFFVPHDYNAEKEARDTAVSWGDFAYYLEKLPCAAVLIMDTCHSGAITVDSRRTRGATDQVAMNQAVENFGRVKHGVVIIAASMSGQLAQERGDWGHGVLTLALLEGIEGRYLYDKVKDVQLPQLSDDDQILSLKELEFYASRRVKELVGGEQAVIGKNPGDVNLDDIPISIHRTAPDE
jgi:hypothetical protein